MHPAERGLSYLLFIYSLIQTHGLPLHGFVYVNSTYHKPKFIPDF